RHRRLAAAADGEVADAQYRNVDPGRLRRLHAAAGDHAVEQRKRRQGPGAPVRLFPPERRRLARHYFPLAPLRRALTMSGWMNGSSAFRVRESAPRISSTVAAPAAIMSCRAASLESRKLTAPASML